MPYPKDKKSPKVAGKDMSATACAVDLVRVSVVEDVDGVRENLVHFINDTEDMECVSQHASAEDALEELPAIKPDVVLMDIHLPKMSGIECVRMLKARLPSTQVLMLTVYEDSDRIFKALLAGANGYLLKGGSAEEIIGAVRDVRAGGSPLNSLIARKVVQFFHTRPPSSDAAANLSAREKEVLALLAKGLPYKQIADALGVGLDTIRKHCHHIYEKMHVNSRTEAVVKYLER
jgi:DNA-binding NarL/FixJ family response regulator